MRRGIALVALMLAGCGTIQPPGPLNLPPVRLPEGRRLVAERSGAYCIEAPRSFALTDFSGKQLARVGSRTGNARAYLTLAEGQSVYAEPRSLEFTFNRVRNIPDEYGNTPDRASPASIGSMRESSFYGYNDVDFAAFQVTRGGTYEIFTENESHGMDAALVLFNRNMHVVAAANHSIDRRPVIRCQLDPGAYSLCIFPDYAVMQGTYAFRIQATDSSPEPSYSRLMYPGRLFGLSIGEAHVSHYLVDALNDALTMDTILKQWGAERPSLFVDAPYITSDDLSAEYVERTLAGFADIVTPRDTFVFYFAGHGDRRDNVAYLPLRFGRITEDRLNELLDDIPGRQLVIIDSCFSGNFREMLEDPRRTIYASTSENQVGYANLRFQFDDPIMNNFMVFSGFLWLELQRNHSDTDALFTEIVDRMGMQNMPNLMLGITPIPIAYPNQVPTSDGPSFQLE
ncbi:caspase family protein [Candidatus Woesearchaeota archaeon]|nr:caspase family protein [Candidatus Woesearchaeota archaeon]